MQCIGCETGTAARGGFARALPCLTRTFCSISSFHCVRQHHLKGRGTPVDTDLSDGISRDRVSLGGPPPHAIGTHAELEQCALQLS